MARRRSRARPRRRAEELRDLAHGLYPPVLRDFGLQAALAAAARRCIPPAALGRQGSAATPKRWRPLSTSAAWKDSRTPQARRLGCDRCNSALGTRSPALLRDRRRRRRLRRRIGPARGSRAGEHVRPDRRARRDPRGRVDAGTGYHDPGEHPGRRRHHAASWSRRPLRLRRSQPLTSEKCRQSGVIERLAQGAAPARCSRARSRSARSGARRNAPRST